MLTPAKIKNHHFEAAGRNAYKSDSVDRFFEEVADSYEQMFRENGEMYKKISLLAERLEEYRKDEDNIRNALLTAQRMAEQIQREAKEKADALLSDAELRAKTENERIDAETNQMMAQATYKAKALVEEAQKHAEKIVFDATYESKAAAISARDMMIKEEAALEMMKVEVTKFKKQILDSYNAQVALISELPELVYAKLDNDEDAQNEPEAVEEIPASVEETPAEAEEPVAVAAFEPVKDEPESSDESEQVDVDTLQQMIDEAVDTDAEDEADEDIDDAEDEQNVEFTGEIVLPEIDEESDFELNQMVDRYTEETEKNGDIFFSKAKKEDESKDGFKVNIDKLSSYGDADDAEEDDYDDDLDEEEYDDDDDDNDNGGIASRFKGFFKK